MALLRVSFGIGGLSVAWLCLGIAACGGAGAREPAAPAEAKNDEADAAAASTSESSTQAGGSQEDERPFAASATEATQIIGEVVEKHQDDLAKCVKEYRFRSHLAHAKVSINIGIGQEGRLMGVTLAKGKEDVELNNCVKTALRDAKFPRSHAGVITITRSFEEMVK